jgi:FkbM family methyltransferase
MSRIIEDTFKNKFAYIETNGYDQTTLLVLEKTKIYEPGLTKFLFTIFPHLDCDFYDIGASFGYFSIIAAKANPNIKVMAFEPEYDSYIRIKYNAKLNNLDNILAYNYYIDKEVGIKVIPRSGSMASTFSDSKDSGIYETMPLWSIHSDKQRIYKMDIEGYEYDVVTGNKEEFMNPKTFAIISEFFLGGENIQKYIKLYNALVKEFPSIYVLDKDLSLIDTNTQIEKFDYNKHKACMNLIFMRREL